MQSQIETQGKHSEPGSFLKSSFARLLVCVYAAIALILGIICIVSTPFGQSNDVWTHVYKIDSTLNGDLFARPVNSVSQYHSQAAENYGGAVDWGLVYLSNNNMMWDRGAVFLYSIDTYTDQTADVPFNNTAVYNPISYAPYLLTLAVANQFDVPAWISYYAMEVVGLAFFILITAIAIACLPRYQVFLAVLLLLLYLPAIFFPWDLFWYLAPFTINPENTLFAFATLFSCLLFKALSSRPSNRLIVWLMVAGFICSISKFVYAPLVLLSLALLIVYKKTKQLGSLESFKNQARIIVIGCAVSIAITLLWMRTASYFATSPYKLTFAQVQLKNQMLLEQPLNVVAEVLQAIFWHHSYLEASGIVIYVFQILLVVLLITAILAKAIEAIGGRRLAFYLVSIAVMLAIMFAIYLAMWLQFTSFKDIGIDGVQGRYFFPMFPLLLLMICSLTDSYLGSRGVGSWLPLFDGTVTKVTVHPPKMVARNRPPTPKQ